MERRASAVWLGGLKDGQGTITAQPNDRVGLPPNLRLLRDEDHMVEAADLPRLPQHPEIAIGVLG